MDARRRRGVIALGLFVLGLAGVAMLLVGLAGSLAFFGQGADGEFRRWTDEVLLWGGGAASLAGATGAALTLLSRRTAVSRAGAAVAALVAMAAIVFGVVAHLARLAPQGRERAALTRLAVRNVAADKLTTGSIPADGATAAGPSGQGPPVAVRSWWPASCASLEQALIGWADVGSVHAPRGFVAGPSGGPSSPSCLWFATYHGWSVRAEVLPAGSRQPATAMVDIAPPGVGL